MTKTKRLLILDCDGTIREPLSGGKFIQHPRDQKIIHGADEAIKLFAKRGWRIVAITNQGGVAAGHKHKSLDDCIEEQLYTLQLFPDLEAIYFCPNPIRPQEICYKVSRLSSEVSKMLDKDGQVYGGFRKPNPGMLRLACAEYQPKNIAFYVGDRPEDEQAALKFLSLKDRCHFEFYWAKGWRNDPGVLIDVENIPF